MAKRKKTSPGKIISKVISVLLFLFLLLSIGYGIGIVPEEWVDALEDATSFLSGPGNALISERAQKETPSETNIDVDDTRTQSNATAVSGEQLSVQVIDVGQADCILASMDDHSMLIDAGNNGDGKKVVSYIKSLGIEHFDYVIGSHAHEDHIGGLDDVIESFEIDTIILPNFASESKTYNDVLSAAKTSDGQTVYPEEGSRYSLGDAEWTILSCKDQTESHSDLNESSIIIKLTYGDIDFLLTGDATEVNEAELLNAGYDLDCEILKVGHHGSAYSSSQEFLKAVSPNEAIISVDAESDLGRGYGHPNEGTLERLKATGANVYRTDRQGTIEVITDGNTYSISSFSTDTDS